MNLSRLIAISSLIIAGEIIFALPFHLARFFRPTLLETFELTATQLGAAQGLYGIVAMLSYFPGGLLADRFPANKLLAISLWMTACGGLYMSSFPSYQESLLLFAFYGITTIMLFWGALIRATREWGDPHTQGTAFGLLESGRGLLAVMLASLGVLIFQWSFPQGYEQSSMLEKKNTFTMIIYIYTTVTAITGFVAWHSLKNTSNKYTALTADNKPNPITDIFTNMKYVFRIPAVWLQAIIVLCAYTGYKGVDHLSLYAVDAYDYDAIEAAKLITLAAWLRPLVAVLSGIAADRVNPITILITSFSLLMLTNLYLSLVTPQSGQAWILVLNVMITCTAVFALRAVYFALFEHYQLTLNKTGSAVGVISLIGFLPDVFVLYIAGRLTDSYSGLQGHQLFFMFLAVTALIGLSTSIVLKYIKR